MNLENLGKIVVILITIIPFNVSAIDKVVLSTNWYAQAEHGGIYQSVAEGIYEKLAVGSLADLANAPSSRNTRTKKKK